jgi:GR25 family glycosyltransferase involved in LPS biosynthesis
MIIVLLIILIIISIIGLILYSINKNTEKYNIINVDKIKYKETPLVSAICITRKRVPYLSRAINDFLEQTYQNKELIIVYDNDDIETENYLLNNFYNYKNIILIKNDKKLKLGELRNLGIKSSNGKCVIQWDDDDEYHPKRIEIQLKIVQQENYQKACCLSRWIIYDNKTNKKYLSNKYNWEGSICSPKYLLLKYKYPSLSKGEDTIVIDSLKKNNNLILVNIPQLYIYHLHWKNTWDSNHGQKLLNLSTPFNYDIPTNNNYIKEFNSLFEVEYINLKKSTQSNKNFLKSCDDAKIIPKRFEAINGSLIVKERNNTLSNGEYGCLLSHKTLWKKYMISNKLVMICEDDIFFNHDITRNVIKKLNYMKDSKIDWNIILLFINFNDESYDNGIRKGDTGDCYLNKSTNHQSYKGYGIIEFGWQNCNMPHIKRKDLVTCISGNCCYIIKPEVCKYLYDLTIYYGDKLPADVILSIAIKQLRNTYYLQGQVSTRKAGDNNSDIKKYGGYKWKGENLN